MTATLSPQVVIHLTFATGALLLGPFALASRKGSRRHRALGYAWITLMLGAAASSLFIRDFRLPNLAGYTPIHLLTAFTFAGIGGALWYVSQRRIRAHRLAMWMTYLGGCVIAGLFTLLPSRYLGDLLWRQLLAVL